MPIKCHFDQIAPDGIAGWAWDPEMPAAAVVVELFDGDAALGSAEASQYRPDLEGAGYRGGYCGFRFRCSPDRRIGDPTKIRGVFRNLQDPRRFVELRGQRLEDGWVDFGESPLSILRPLGLGLETLRGRRQLGPLTRLEPPVIVKAIIADGTTLDIGAFTGVYGGSLNACSIGRYCSIAPDVVIGPREHAVDWLTTSLIAEQPRLHNWHEFINSARAEGFRVDAPVFAGKLPKTTIGSDVWLGQGAFVRAGVTIGDGAVIGAHAVVVGDIPPYAIAVGNPARVKRLRFAEPVVERLMKLRWWRYSLYDLMGSAPFDRIDAALDTIEARIDRGDLTEYRPMPYTVARLRDALSAAPKSR